MHNQSTTTSNEKKTALTYLQVLGTIQFCTVLTVLTVLYCTYCTVYCIVLTVLYWLYSVLYLLSCIVITVLHLLYCNYCTLLCTLLTVLHCTVMYNTIIYFTVEQYRFTLLFIARLSLRLSQFSNYSFCLYPYSSSPSFLLLDPPLCHPW